MIEEGANLIRFELARIGVADLLGVAPHGGGAA